MRLDDFDPNAINVEDQRGSGRSIGRSGGKIGLGTLLIALVASYFFGTDVTQMLSGLEQGQTQGPIQTQGGTTASESCTADPLSRETCNALSSLNKTWEPVFRASNIQFLPPKLVF